MADHKKSLLIFDCCDTIWAAVHQYDEAYIECIAFLQKVFGEKLPGLHSVYHRLFQLEGQTSKSWGVKRGRVAQSMVTLYEEICAHILEQYGVDLKDCTHINTLKTIGDKPFDYRWVTWLPNAKTVLRLLKKDGHELRFLTSYDKELFPKRAKYLGLYEFASPERCVSVESKKTTDDFVSVSKLDPNGEQNFEKVYVIGNGRNDILPAVDISEKWYGIYIPHSSTSPWFSDDKSKVKFTPDPIDHPRVYNLRRLTEILNII